MKHVIIGTAGHIDHGKTWLVKALTGVDTDRLAEEKRRGITIELGFAQLVLEGGTRAGLVDVPGHEKFIRNMLAGAGEIDLCMLVVAADEGFMPQTEEHLNILSLLGLEKGLVVLTKADLVTPDWMEEIRADTRRRIAGTFLEGCPMLEVSAATGAGIPELRRALGELIAQTREKQIRGTFRMPVDRVFSVDGFGTVVTGTVIGGAVRVGETVELVPSGLRGRVRSLQVHGEGVDTACAGQRAALNLAGVKTGDIRRGESTVTPGSVAVTQMLDVRLRCLKDAKRAIRSGSQIHLHHGTAVCQARVVLLDRDALAPGECCYAQLRLAGPIAAQRGDRFVIRFFSPVETIGGGIVLDEVPLRHKRNDPAALAALTIREMGSDEEKVLQAAARQGTALPTAAELAQAAGCGEETVRDLAARGKLCQILPGRYMESGVLDGLWAKCRGLLATYHDKNPLHAGMRAPELRQKLLRDAPAGGADALLAQFQAEGRLRRQGERWALAEFQVRYTKRQAALLAQLLERYRQGGMAPDTAEEMLAAFPPAEQAEARRVLESAVTAGSLVMLTPELFWHREIFQRALDTLTALAQTGPVTLAAVRDALGTTRKYALLFLEHCDRCRITRKEGDTRYLN